MNDVEVNETFERVLSELAALRVHHERLQLDHAALQRDRERLHQTVERLRETVEGGASRIQDRPRPAVREPAPGGIEDVAAVTRRGLLHRLGTVAAAGAGLAAAGSIVAAGPAKATHVPGFGHRNALGDGESTYVRGRSDAALLEIENLGPADAIQGTSQKAAGVRGVSDTSSGVYGDSRDGRGVMGFSSYGTGVYGETHGAHAVHGLNLNSGNGVFGEHSSVGNAILGINHGPGNGVFSFKPEGVAGDAVVGFARSGRGVHAVSDTGIALEVGGSARLLQTLRATAGAPTTGSFFAGEQIRDANGELWLCIAPGSPGTWRRAALVRNGFAGGSVNFLAKPIRIFDSRSGAPLANGTARDVQVTGVVVGGVSVPAGAVGVIGNVTVTQTVAPNGYLTLYPQGSPPSPATANINWFAASQNLNTSAIVALNAANGRLTIHNGMAGGSNATHVVFDVAAFVV
jgi:hypothetical protein